MGAARASCRYNSDPCLAQETGAGGGKRSLRRTFCNLDWRGDKLASARPNRRASALPRRSELPQADDPMFQGPGCHSVQTTTNSPLHPYVGAMHRRHLFAPGGKSLRVCSSEHPRSTAASENLGILLVGYTVLEALYRWWMECFFLFFSCAREISSKETPRTIFLFQWWRQDSSGAIRKPWVVL